jgi:molecular chaperone GrpE
MLREGDLMIKDTHNGKDLKDDKTRASESSKMYDAGVSPEENNADGKIAMEDASAAEGTGKHDADNRLKTLQDDLQKKNQELESLKDVMLRRQADFENYKKRMIKSQDEYRKNAIRDMSQDIISVNDDLLRAIASASDTGDSRDLEKSHTAFIEGVSIISKSIEEVLKKYGVREIESLNREYDPTHNEAVEIEESDTVAIPMITKVYQKGFALDDMVVRSARVRVTRPVAKDNGEAGQGNV